MAKLKASKLITLYYKPIKNRFVPGVLEGESIKVPEDDIESYLKQGHWVEEQPGASEKEEVEAVPPEATKTAEKPIEKEGGPNE